MAMDLLLVIVFAALFVFPLYLSTCRGPDPVAWPAVIGTYLL
jgi:hypothetical protein